jgi:hypothetical protein
MLAPIDFSAVVSDLTSGNPRRIPWIELEQLGAHPSGIFAAAVAAGETRLARLAKAAAVRSALRAQKAGRLDSWLAA